jgi:hypothetical protein
MSKYVSIKQEVASEIREKLKKIAELEVTAQQKQQLELENTLLKNIIVLIKKGSIHPHESIKTMEDVLKDPSKLNKISNFTPNEGKLIDRNSGYTNVSSLKTEDDFLKQLNNIIIGDK